MLETAWFGMKVCACMPYQSQANEATYCIKVSIYHLRSIRKHSEVLRTSLGLQLEMVQLILFHFSIIC